MLFTNSVSKFVIFLDIMHENDVGLMNGGRERQETETHTLTDLF